MKKIVIGITSSNATDIIRRISVIERQGAEIGGLVASGLTNQFGGLIIEVPDGEYLVIKEASANTENSEVFDYVTPVVYSELSFRVRSYDAEWIYLKPQVIGMNYVYSVPIKSVSGEFRINGGAWTTEASIKDSDILEMRLPVPPGGLYSEVIDYRIKVGPYTYQYKLFDETPGVTIPEYQTSFYKIQNINTKIYELNNQVSFYKIQNINPKNFEFNNQVSFYKIQNINPKNFEFNNQVSFYKIQVIRTV